MARWKPGDSIDSNELIGRRLFDEPMLRGVEGQPSFTGIQLSHFEETRDNKISLDRLGASGFDRKVSKYLLPRAEAAGKSFSKPKPFHGWFAVRAKELKKTRKGQAFIILASPIVKPEPEDNIYHAHVVRPDEMNPYAMALQLRHIFTTYGNMEENSKLKKTRWDTFWEHPFTRWVFRLFYKGNTKNLLIESPEE